VQQFPFLRSKKLQKSVLPKFATMDIIMSITVTVRMENGELRAGLELRSLTEQDGRDLAELIDTAKERGLYDEEAKILGFNGLAGYHLYWPGLGAMNREAFRRM
jgi:hypothetical protein